MFPERQKRKTKTNVFNITTFLESKIIIYSQFVTDMESMDIMFQSILKIIFLTFCKSK